MAGLQLGEIQGLLFSGYVAQRSASYLLLRVTRPEAARGFVTELAGRVTWGRERGAAAAEGSERLNVGFTARGLRALGLGDLALLTFQPPFHEGMDSPRHARALGDEGASHPSRWEWGSAAAPVDAVLLLYADDEATHERQVERETEAARAGGFECFRRLRAAPLGPPDVLGHEHFGFADGISQPFFEGSPQEEGHSTEGRRLHRVAAGEFVLGQRNAYDGVTPVPRLGLEESPPFGTNGSYLVLRQLYQDVASFWRCFEAAAGGDAARAERLAAKAVGRWRDGSPLTECPLAPDPGRGRHNDFGFASRDPFGERCPVGSHVRRANPRDSLEEDPKVALQNANAHRILRRGRSYGAPLADRRVDDGVDRGLFFLCLNANIERQFEFVQHSWVDNPTFDGLHGERDPVMGSQPEGGGRFTVQAGPVRERLSGIGRFVEVRGGAYFFLPGRTGLLQIAGLGR
jgi:Dyp-type peroxidase family